MRRTDDMASVRHEGRKRRSDVRVSNTAFVDPMSRGDEHGRLYDPARPYLTICGAIAAIRGTAPVAAHVEHPQWTVRAAPGAYDERVALPSGIGLVGAGRECTLVNGTIEVMGSGRVEALTISAPALPALAVRLAGPNVCPPPSEFFSFFSLPPPFFLSKASLSIPLPVGRGHGEIDMGRGQTRRGAVAPPKGTVRRGRP